MLPRFACCPQERYRTFLESILTHTPLGHEFFHAFPQAIKTNVVAPAADDGRRFDAILKLEMLEDGLAAIAQQLGLAFHGRGSLGLSDAVGASNKGASCCSGLERA